MASPLAPMAAASLGGSNGGYSGQREKEFLNCPYDSLQKLTEEIPDYTKAHHEITVRIIWRSIIIEACKA